MMASDPTAAIKNRLNLCIDKTSFLVSRSVGSTWKKTRQLFRRAGLTKKPGLEQSVFVCCPRAHGNAKTTRQLS